MFKFSKVLYKFKQYFISIKKGQRKWEETVIILKEKKKMLKEH